jgi:hypothetical protein
MIDVAIIGSGPYGLSLAAHLHSRGVDFRIFGVPMGPWRDHMPEGMLLKSYPWASDLSDPEAHFTVKQFCAERGLPYNDTLIPLPLDTFISYGEAFQTRFVPAVERKLLVSLEPTASGLCARFDDGEIVSARRVVLAVGWSAFKYVPPVGSRLPAEVASHSSDHGPLHRLEGKEVAIIGSGSSATDLAALLHEKGIPISLVARAGNLKFASRPRLRSLTEKVVAPMSGIGNGWTMGVCSNAPWLVHLLPEEPRVRLANSRVFGPLGGAFMSGRVSKVPLWLGRTISEIALGNGRAHLHLAGADGKKDVLQADHVIFATGYKIDMSRLDFLDPGTVARMRLFGGAPRLSRHYESSIPGLHFIGPASASSFGPVCRFVFGARHPARHLAHYLPAVLGRRAIPVVSVQTMDSAVLQ